MPLQPNTDYVYVPTVDVTDEILATGATKACLVGTKGFLFIVPVSAVNIQPRGGIETWWKIGTQDPRTAVEAMLADPGLTLEQLEKALQGLLAGMPQRRVLNVHDAEKFQIKTGWLTGGLTFKLPGEARKTLNLRGKENKLAVKAFYAGLER